MEEETIQISDDYNMLAASLDDLLADDISDEGFAELDSPKVTSQLNRKLSLEIYPFKKVQNRLLFL